MAPIRPPTGRQASTKSSIVANRRSISDNGGFSNPLFPTTKSDKRIIKRSILLSNIARSNPSSNGQKRRRPNKKLAATLEELADALPDTGDASGSTSVTVGQAQISRRSKEEIGKNMASLKSKKGIRKKKEELERKEKTRFGLNMAEMMKPQNDGQVVGVNQRWEALRKHVEQNVEKRPGI